MADPEVPSQTRRGTCPPRRPPRNRRRHQEGAARHRGQGTSSTWRLLPSVFRPRSASLPNCGDNNLRLSSLSTSSIAESGSPRFTLLAKNKIKKNESLVVLNGRINQRLRHHLPPLLSLHYLSTFPPQSLILRQWQELENVDRWCLYCD